MVIVCAIFSSMGGESTSSLPSPLWQCNSQQATLFKAVVEPQSTTPDYCDPAATNHPMLRALLRTALPYPLCGSVRHSALHDIASSQTFLVFCWLSFRPRAGKAASQLWEVSQRGVPETHQECCQGGRPRVRDISPHTVPVTSPQYRTSDISPILPCR